MNPDQSSCKLCRIPSADLCSAVNDERTTNSAFFFAILLASHAIAAASSPIQDCDEVFNFWEPTHYLNHGYGLQTWELSPEYAIRSWLYTALHAIPIKLFSWAWSGPPKTAEFFFLRGLLAVTCAACETLLYRAASKRFGARVGVVFAVCMATSTGLLHASVSYLPSTFAMYLVMLACAAALEADNVRLPPLTLLQLSIAAIIGWPFAGALAIPFVLEDASSLCTRDTYGFVARLIKASAGPLIVLGAETAVDSMFYRKLVSVPLNIVLYNVFSSDKGPNIYGTEPWHFYARNLMLNFNFWFPLALLSLPLYCVRLLLTRDSTIASRKGSRSITVLSLLYLWLGIFTLQPHKEERFMYPIYPLLALNAAVTLDMMADTLSAKSAWSVVSASLDVQRMFTGFIVSTLVITSILRSAGLVGAYSAPLELYSDLGSYVGNQGGERLINVCVGKEWYRFASSYHMPDFARLRFIKSDFAGLLPGAFHETAEPHLGRFPATHIIPPGMNDENKEDLGKYISVDHCDVLVDSWSESTTVSRLEPNYIQDTASWRKLRCLPFLDVASTHTLGRIFWTPSSSFIPQKFRRKWGEYCLLESLRRR